MFSLLGGRQRRCQFSLFVFIWSACKQRHGSGWARGWAVSTQNLKLPHLALSILESSRGCCYPELFLLTLQAKKTSILYASLSCPAWYQLWPTLVKSSSDSPQVNSSFLNFIICHLLFTMQYLQVMLFWYFCPEFMLLSVGGSVWAEACSAILEAGTSRWSLC